MIVFVRHGQTEANAVGLLQGRADIALTDLGREQAALVAAALPAVPRRVVASPLQRAVDTAAPIAARFGLDVEVDDRLVELDYGDWDRRAFGDVTADEWRRWRDDPSFAPPGGESLEDVAARAASFCAEMLGAGDDVVAVSHVSPIKAAVAWALDGGTAVTWHLFLDLASVTRVARRPDGRACLLSFNETAHLRAG